MRLLLNLILIQEYYSAIHLVKMKEIICIMIFLGRAVFENAQKFVSAQLSDGQILKLIDQNRPSKGGRVPEDLKYTVKPSQLSCQHFNDIYILSILHLKLSYLSDL